MRLKRSNATRHARAEPAFVRRAAKSECPSERSMTASPSIRALSAVKLQTASATSVGEIRTVAAPKGHSASLLAGEDPVAVVLDLVQPARAGGRPIDEERLTREDETSRRGAPGTLGRDTPQHALVYRGLRRERESNRKPAERGRGGGLFKAGEGLLVRGFSVRDGPIAVERCRPNIVHLRNGDRGDLKR